MRRDLILGTAGHIDHGKTALVRVLTGIDCDRLPEERKRGITIDIGFAHLDLGEVHLGVVDVPGHERFIKNMLAGASGVDLVLLVVSAGESIRPQTREHLEIFKLLGVRCGVIALTKTDLVDATTREVVGLEVRDLVKGTFLENAPLIPTSVFNLEGIQELKEALKSQALQLIRTDEGQNFRLPIDRAFVIQGHGTVVTGSVLSGRVKVGDELEWLPGRQRVRVRSLQNHDAAVERLHRGQRAAINLAGVDHADVKRGQELATPGFLLPSRLLTVQLSVLDEARGPVKHRTEARLHLGTAEVMTAVSLLDDGTLAPGKSGLAQLSTDEPVEAVWGQPFVLRDSSAEHTLGGGRVLQPVAHRIRRRKLEVLEHLQRLDSVDPIVRVEASVWLADWRGCFANDVCRDAGVSLTEAGVLSGNLQAGGRIVEIASTAGGVLVHVERLQELEQQALAAAAALHAENPLATSHEESRLFSRLEYVDRSEILQHAVEGLVRQKKLLRDGKRLAHAEFKPKLSAGQRKLKEKIIEAHRTAGLQPPSASSFSAQAGANSASLADIFEVAVAENQIVRIADDIFLHADTAARMIRTVEEQLTAHPAGLTVAQIRDVLGTTRKYAVPFCEYLDEIGITRRDGDVRLAAHQSLPATR